MLNGALNADAVQNLDGAAKPFDKRALYVINIISDRNYFSEIVLLDNILSTHTYLIETRCPLSEQIFLTHKLLFAK